MEGKSLDSYSDPIAIEHHPIAPSHSGQGQQREQETLLSPAAGFWGQERIAEHGTPNCSSFLGRAAHSQKLRARSGCLLPTHCRRSAKCCSLALQLLATAWFGWEEGTRKKRLRKERSYLQPMPPCSSFPFAQSLAGLSPCAGHGHTQGLIQASLPKIERNLFSPAPNSCRVRVRRQSF